MPQKKKTEARRCTEAMRDVLIAFRTRMEDDLRDTGVTLPQLRMLKAVEDHQQVSAASIARLCHVTPQTLHAMLSRAAREGWIVRGSAESNQRFVTVALTPQGEALLAHGTRLKEQIEARLWHGLSAGAVRAARVVLEAGLANLVADDAGEPERALRHPRR